MKKFAFVYFLLPLCLFGSIARAGFIYGGLNAEIAFSVGNKNYSDQASDTTILSFFSDSLMLGLGIRFGYENTLFDHMYVAGEIYTRFIFGVNGSPISVRNFKDTYASVGLAAKLGASMNNEKFRLYAILASEYMAAIFPSGSDVSRAGLILVGTGVGFKQELYYFIDIFVECKVMFDVFGHIVYDASQSTNPSITHSGSLGYQLLSAAVGIELKI